MPPLDNALVASVAARLDAAHIPNILWGHYMLTIFGIPTIVDGIDFVVDDDFIDAAYATLLDAGFKNCISKDCLRNKELGYAPKPHIHLHINKSDHLCFHKKSNILWRIPDLTYVDGESIILASDPGQLPGPDIIGRGGRFQQDLHPVRVPTVSQLVRSLLSLAKKDASTYGGYWMHWISYILDFCTANGVFDGSGLTGSYKTFITAYLEGYRASESQAFERISLTE